ncbi:MAG: hypothetical protein ACYCPS_06600, partial [Candidatus Saccharimonadales bacterium]
MPAVRAGCAGGGGQGQERSDSPGAAHEPAQTAQGIDPGPRNGLRRPSQHARPDEGMSALDAVSHERASPPARRDVAPEPER